MNKFTASRRKIIAGVEFEAVRVTGGWKPKVCLTGFVLAQGYATRPKMWRDLDYIAKVRGEERFKAESLFNPSAS